MTETIAAAGLPATLVLQPGLQVPQWLVPQSFADVERMAAKMALAEWVPYSYKNKRTQEVDRNKVELAIMHGQTVGIPAVMAPQVIAVINGTPTIWGDGMLALVMQSGLLDDINEVYTGEVDDLEAICSVKRKGMPSPHEVRFSVFMAKRAGLWGKEGPWTTAPRRMLRMRARAFALRDRFPDVLKGLRMAEEVLDEIIDVTPARTGPASAERPERENYRPPIDAEFDAPVAEEAALAEKPVAETAAAPARKPRGRPPAEPQAAPVPPPPPPPPPEPARAEPEPALEEATLEPVAFELTTGDGEVLEWSDWADFPGAYKEELGLAFSGLGLSAGDGFYETNRPAFLEWAKNNAAQAAELDQHYNELRKAYTPPDETSVQTAQGGGDKRGLF